MKKILLFVFLFVFVLGACAPAPSPEKVIETVVVTELVEGEVVEAVQGETIWRTAQDGKPFRFPHWMQQHPVMKLMTSGFLQACDDYGLLCQLDGIEGDDDASVVAVIETMTLDNTSGIVTGMFFPSRFAAGLVAIERGIPLVSQHVPASLEDVPGLLAWSAPDLEGFGIGAAKAMAEKVECQGPVAVTQSSLAENENALSEQFVKTLKEECPGIEVLDTQPMGLDISASIPKAVGIIQANPDLTGAFDTCGNGAQYWAAAASESGKEPGEIAIISMDYTRPNLDLIKSGEAYMLIGQPLYEECYWATVLLANHLVGLPVPFDNLIPAPLITLENVDQFYAINDFAESVSIK